MKNIAYLFLILSLFFASCENEEVEFPDFDYQTVYFAHQYPVRTITLGEDIFETSLDNEWKFKIMATTGGVYENDHDISIDVIVDNALVEDFSFQSGGNQVLAMPDNYYTLQGEQIVIPQGEIIGGVTVEITDVFFADPLALSRNYVIPMKMNNVQHADSILSGVPQVENPRRGVTGDWAVQPKDYTFYAVKFINPYHGYYLRRGEDVMEGKNGNSDLDQTIIRSEQHVEDDEVVMLSTQSLNAAVVPLVLKDSEGNNINISLSLKFDEEGNVRVEGAEDAEYTVSGSGKFVKDGEKKSWGDKDRDAIYLDYEIELADFQVSTTDTLVLRNRGVAMETFSPVLEN